MENDAVELELSLREVEDVLVKELSDERSCQGFTHGLMNNIIYKIDS